MASKVKRVLTAEQKAKKNAYEIKRRQQCNAAFQKLRDLGVTDIEIPIPRVKKVKTVQVNANGIPYCKRGCVKNKNCEKDCAKRTRKRTKKTKTVKKKLKWNDFVKSKKGQNLSITQISKLYKEQ